MPDDSVPILVSAGRWDQIAHTVETSASQHAVTHHVTSDHPK